MRRLLALIFALGMLAVNPLLQKLGGEMALEGSNLAAQPPEGWVKWRSPAYEYLVAEPGEGEGFGDAIAYLAAQGLSLAGAAYDRTIPGAGCRIYLPIRRI